ncbi:MAG: UDP-N-acetylglucosamine 4,6-dehydratase (inverting) [Blastochloris sp.]|nr:UDP-N-acetylglucosamine 4,6-dehydratase (inverting) [Blastochloris sp.]
MPSVPEADLRPRKSTGLRSFDDPPGDLADTNVLVTGGTGSFGRAFVRRLLTCPRPPRRVVIISRDEQKQESMAREWMDQPDAFDRLRFFIGDVRDAARLELAMRGVDYVVHAAALKIVPLAEYNPFECILTNVHGAENVVKAALRNQVRKVIALSTDKAANPANLYGASKLAADKIMVAANNLSGDLGTQFSVVRYGNVIGSRGSVVPLFQAMLAKGVRALPITDERMTRFWITLDQGVSFVLSSLAVMSGGEIFVPKIPSMRIVDVATALAPDLPHAIIGIRPGEKLHEVMITEDDARTTIELDDRYAICPPTRGWSGAHLKAGGRLVADGFRYTSDSNVEWLGSEDLLALIGVQAAA